MQHYHEAALESLLGDPCAVSPEVLNPASNIDEAQKSSKLRKLQARMVWQYSIQDALKTVQKLLTNMMQKR